MAVGSQDFPAGYVFAEPLWVEVARECQVCSEIHIFLGPGNYVSASHHHLNVRIYPLRMCNQVPDYTRLKGKMARQAYPVRLPDCSIGPMEACPNSLGLDGIAFPVDNFVCFFPFPLQNPHFD